MTVATMTLLIGLPGAGKTTVAKRLEHERSALRLTPDEWMGPLFGAGEYEGRRWVLESQLLWGVAARALTLGVSVILDYGCWSEEERELFRSRTQAMDARAELIVLDPPIEVLRQRLAARRPAAATGVFGISRAELESYDRVFERPSAEELARYDHHLVT